MKITIIAGSQRKNSNSAKIADLISQDLHIKYGTSVHLRDLGKDPLPFWGEEIKDSSSQIAKSWQVLSEELDSSSAFIFVTPEWGGMVPAALKNFFLFCKRELAHKPALLVGVTSGISGAYPISELRASSYKNTGVCYIPDQLIIRNVENFLQFQASDSKDTIIKSLTDRKEHLLKMLIDYANALQQLRTNANFDLSAFTNGM